MPEAVDSPAMPCSGFDGFCQVLSSPQRLVEGLRQIGHLSQRSRKERLKTHSSTQAQCLHKNKRSTEQLVWNLRCLSDASTCERMPAFHLVSVKFSAHIMEESWKDGLIRSLKHGTKVESGRGGIVSFNGSGLLIANAMSHASIGMQGRPSMSAKDLLSISCSGVVCPPGLSPAASRRA